MTETKIEIENFPEFSVVLFDGVCNMCNSFVNFVLQRDSNVRFRFASLQSPYGLATLAKLGLPNDLSTVVLVEPDGTYSLKSSAILKITENLTFPWYLGSYFLWIPTPVRDLGYWGVATSRYYLFGQSSVCNYNPQWRDRFLSECPINDPEKMA